MFSVGPMKKKEKRTVKLCVFFCAGDSEHLQFMACQWCHIYVKWCRYNRLLYAAKWKKDGRMRNKTYKCFRSDTFTHMCGASALHAKIVLERCSSDRPNILWLLNRKQSYTWGDHSEKKREKKASPTIGFMETLGRAATRMISILRSIKCWQRADKTLFVGDGEPLAIRQTCAPTPSVIYKGRNHDSRRQE